MKARYEHFKEIAATIIMAERKKQLICNVNIAFYQTLPQDAVSHIICFIPKIYISPRDIRQKSAPL